MDKTNSHVENSDSGIKKDLQKLEQADSVRSEEQADSVPKTEEPTASTSGLHSGESAKKKKKRSQPKVIKRRRANRRASECDLTEAEIDDAIKAVLLEQMIKEEEERQLRDESDSESETEFVVLEVFTSVDIAFELL